MTRMTIDLWNRPRNQNSSIAVLKGMAVEVFKNNDGLEYTPSAVWIDKGQPGRRGSASQGPVL